jgi:glycosyltransferase involved in cell wall biosynthesis
MRESPSDAGLRLLAVTAVPPWPMEDGYSVRAGNFLAQISRRHDVTVVSPEPARAPDRPGRERMEWLPVEGVPATNVLPWREERHALADRVASLVRERDFEMALLWNGTEFLAGEIAGFPPAVADRIDCEALQAWRGRRHRIGFSEKLRQLRRGLELAAYERRVLPSLEGLVVTGPDDARALRLVSGHDRVEVIPNGVDLPRLEGLPGETDRPTVIFTGVLSYGPNIEAARHFARDVWPGVRRRVPDARFVIAGRSPAADVEALATEPGVTVHPDVPDLTTEIRRAWVAVAPMQSGSGIKNKVLEAWAAERPVVLTELATNGLGLDGAADSLRGLVCRDAGEMARTVAELLEDRPGRRQLGREGRTLARERHSWEAAGRSLARFLAASRPGAGRAGAGVPADGRDAAPA